MWVWALHWSGDPHRQSWGGAPTGRYPAAERSLSTTRFPHFLHIHVWTCCSFWEEPRLGFRQAWTFTQLPQFLPGRLAVSRWSFRKTGLWLFVIHWFKHTHTQIPPPSPTYSIILYFIFTLFFLYIQAKMLEKHNNYCHFSSLIVLCCCYTNVKTIPLHGYYSKKGYYYYYFIYFNPGVGKHWFILWH